METILIKLLEKLISDKFIGRMVMLLLATLARSTGNSVDDNICKAVGDALAEPCKID